MCLHHYKLQMAMHHTIEQSNTVNTQKGLRENKSMNLTTYKE